MDDERRTTTDQPDDELATRLRRAYPVAVDDGMRTRHHVALDASLARARAWRRRLATVAAALTLSSTTAGLAVAAESSVPGDRLYPIKLATEAARSLFDDDIAARHRVEEVEALLDRGAEPEQLVEAVAAATRALQEIDDDTEAHRQRLSSRLEQITQLVQDRLNRLPTGVTPTIPDVPPLPNDLMDVPWPSGLPTPASSPTTATSSPPPAEPTPSTDEGKPADVRFETHQALDAGSVTLKVSDDGVRLATVEAAAGWSWQANTDDEPDRLVVGFTDGQRQVVLFAVATDSGVQVEVRETSPREGTPSGS